ncbi:hypothetical protein P308_16810 [Pseudomonas piscis]|nr:hypothetical protein P308_16810 [Pseudomonas piscis]
MRRLQLAGMQVPVIGQGTWRMGEDPRQRDREVAALRCGLDLGLSLIDTAEMYGEGGAEEVVGRAIAGRRDEVFLISKAYPHNAGRKSLPQACERSLQRLGTEIIDLYLLHWRGQYPLEETVAAFERLRQDGKIRRWGVSNFDVADLDELDTPACATNQVLYNLESRGVEFDLLPTCQRLGIPLMAYCPIGQGGALLAEPVLLQVARRHGVTPARWPWPGCCARTAYWPFPRPYILNTYASMPRLASCSCNPRICRSWTGCFRPPLASSAWGWSEACSYPSPG